MDAQRGFTLIEVLVSVLLFSLAIVTMAALQATAIQLSSDAQQRAEAAFLADQLFARMLISNPADAALFAHHPTVNPQNPCSPTGPASTYPALTEWLADVKATLPRAKPDEQSVNVTGSGASTEVTVTLCWKNQDSDELPHAMSVTNRPQWQP